MEARVSRSLPTNHLFTTISTPLCLGAWKQHLVNHPDQDFVRFIVKGMEEGFPIGVDPTASFMSAHRNMSSAAENPQVIEDYLTKEVAAGNIFGPFSPSALPEVHINRFGVIPKKYQPGKWRLITDLSYPEGSSVNDAIDPSLCSLTYTSVDVVAATAAALGKGALLAKIDVKSAYRLVPVHPGQRKWLGMQWQGKVYVDGMLPFGLRSAPKIFNAVADALEWCVAKQGIRHIYHYLDDFIVLGSPGTAECGASLSILQRVCQELGVPLAPEKQDGPAAVLTFLGIEIDTIRQELRLPAEKLQRLLQMVDEWENQKACTRRELESLIGILQHACKVIQPGRSFLRRAISLLSITKQPHHHIRLNAEFRSDIKWWKAFAAHWNGAAILAIPEQYSLHLTSDASGFWGCGAWHATHWFQLEWSPNTQDWNIAAKELLPIVIAAVIWRHLWRGRQVIARCDNAAVVAVLNSRYSKDKHMMHLLRCVFFAEAYGSFKLVAVHLPGSHNVLADDLSRNRLYSFRMQFPESDTSPTSIPSSLLQWLSSTDLDWTSPAWTQLFNTTVARV